MTKRQQEAEAVLKQIEFCRNLRLSASEASELFGVPKTTIFNRRDEVQPDADGRYSFMDLLDWRGALSPDERGIRDDIFESAKLELEAANLEAELSKLKKQKATKPNSRRRK